ncbi:hypothetical protein ILUMI_20399 [Ignelater luminosus]|uniref:Casein kinase II subunit alpha n=1 Tax=Ignelater luminosus TaxID=2038154 RepID=A0A8K0G4L4_IGNLU|nr:hypothetical protein ILUMI_20399 [Ignelater luminosus]
MPQIPAIPRNYANVLADKPQDYSDCENTTIDREDGGNYKLIKEISKGYSSKVYEARHIPTRDIIVCKVLKANCQQILKREVKILKTLSKGINIINLLGVTHFSSLSADAMLFEKMDTCFHDIFMELDEYHIKYYGLQILQALDYSHSKGIMHCDIKPHNIMVDIADKKLKLIDWGVAEFYEPQKQYTTKVCTRYYMAPELLTDFKYYNYAVDMWSVGCIFASMIFHKKPFFNGKDKFEQLKKVVKVLGSDNLRDYLSKYDIMLHPVYDILLFPYEEISFTVFKNDCNKHLVNEDSCSLIQSLLCFDPAQRATATETINHQYFSNMSEPLQNGAGPSTSTS